MAAMDELVLGAAPLRSEDYYGRRLGSKHGARQTTTTRRTQSR